jgi:hypothetical protein
MASPSAEQLVRLLSDDARAVTPASFPADAQEAARPGLYAWWADEQARDLFGEVLGSALPPLIYLGQAGATRWPSGKRSSATLLSRIRGQHIGGNARSSTFRRTISSILLDALRLTPAGGGKFDKSSNDRVSAWIARHLAVAIAPYDDRDSLSQIESAVIAMIDPPLNLDHCPPSPVRQRLAELRSNIRRS